MQATQEHLIAPARRVVVPHVPSWMAHKDHGGTPVSSLVEDAADRVLVGCDLRATGVGPLLVVDAFRQAVMAASHAVYAVPASSAFAMNAIATTIEPDEIRRLRQDPTLTLALTFDPTWRRGRLGGARVDADLVRDGRRIGRASAELVVLTPAQYARVRGDRRRRHFRSGGDRLRAATVGARSAGHVLVGAPDEERRFPIRLDTDRLAFCDHAVDHVPGMTLLEAVRQAMRALPSAYDASSWSAHFLRYVEIEAPLVVDLGAIGTDGGEATVLDGQEPVVRVRLG